MSFRMQFVPFFGPTQNNSNIYSVIPSLANGCFMKKLCSLSLILICSFLSFSQQTYTFNDPYQKFNEAKEYFQKEQYNLAYPILKELQASVNEAEKINNPVMVQEINYYTIVSELKQNEGRAEQHAREYVDLTKNNARVQMMNFHLAEYFFRKQ